MGEMPAQPGPEVQGNSGGAAPPAEMMGGAPPTEEGPDLMGALVAVFEAIPKLKGRVWLGGTPILEPEAMGGEDWVVTVWLEDPTDKATIVNYVKQNAPELYGHLEFRTGEPGEEPAIPVGGEEMPEGMPGEMQGGAMPEMSEGAMA